MYKLNETLKCVKDIINEKNCQSIYLTNNDMKKVKHTVYFNKQTLNTGIGHYENSKDGQNEIIGYVKYNLKQLIEQCHKYDNIFCVVCEDQKIYISPSKCGNYDIIRENKR